MTQVPANFYKYCSAQTAKIVLNSSSFRWSAPPRLNDPYELRIRPMLGRKHVEILSDYMTIILTHVYDNPCISSSANKTTNILIALYKELKDAGISKEEAQKDVMAEYPIPERSKTKSMWDQWIGSLNPMTARMFCVSESGSILMMWSHYADSHRGCCFELRHIQEMDTPLMAAKKVIYTKDMPDIPMSVNDLIYGTGQETKAQALDCLLYTKGIDWSYEKEWRCITYRDEKDKDYSDFVFYPNEIQTIIIGNKMDSDSETEIRAIVRRKYPNTQVVRAELEEDKFEVTWKCV